MKKTGQRKTEERKGYKNKIGYWHFLSKAWLVLLIIAFVAAVERWIDEKVAQETPEQFWNAVKEWIEKKRADLISTTLQKCTNEQKSLISEMRKDAKEVLEVCKDTKKVHDWLNKLSANIDYLQLADNSAGLLGGLLKDLEKIKGTNDRFMSTEGEAKAWADKFTKIASEHAHMAFEIIDQPMNTSSTKVREHGKLYMVAGPPFADSTVGLRRYPSYQVPATNRSDREIAANILVNLIDLNLVPRGKNGQITRNGLKKHLGENLSPLVNMNLLLKEVNRRLSEGDLESALYSNTRQFNDMLVATRERLEEAYGNALHAIDGYVMKFFIEDSMFERLADKMRQQNNINPQGQAKERINSIRSLIGKRAGVIITQSEKERLSSQRQDMKEKPSLVDSQPIALAEINSSA